MKDSSKGFVVQTSGGDPIRFLYYLQEAPATCTAFQNCLPFSRSFVHARVSGQEIWVDAAPQLNIIQENASVFTEAGEVVAGPLHPVRNKTSGCLGIYYGEGKGLDACNIFARVMEEDRSKLQALGETIWRHGQQLLYFESL